MTDLDQLAKVKGLTPVPVCEKLYDLAARVPAGQAIVELGVFKGRTACYLGAGARSGGGAHVWAFDPWDLPGDRMPFVVPTGRRRKHWVEFTTKETRLAAKRNVHRNGLREQVTLVRGFSVEEGLAWEGPPVGLLYVDGDHRLDAVHADFGAWRPHLAPGAVVAFDDYQDSHHEVIEAVDAMAAAGDVAVLEIVGGRLAVTQIPGPASNHESARSTPEAIVEERRQAIERPKANEPKAAWETWARSVGYATAGLTKADLQKLQAP
jgi:predicted O-methyltransferase YrrM